MRDKGFSLFTPLVGTALVIMSIIVSTVLIQNDVRVSRGLSASYEVEAQAISARLIKATAETKTIVCVKEGIKQYLMTRTYGTAKTDQQGFGGQNFSYECTSASDCWTQFNKMLTASSYLWKAVPYGPLYCVYSGVPEAIKTATDYKPDYTKFDLSVFQSRVSTELLRDHPEAMQGTWDGDYYKVTVNPDEWLPKDLFAIPFTLQSDTTNKITVSIVPFAFSYKTPWPVGKYFNQTADAFFAMDSSNACGKMSSLQTAGANNALAFFDSNNTGRKALTVEWNLGSGASTFQVTIVSSGFYSPSNGPIEAEKYVGSAVGSKSSSVSACP